jgi:hypothetical protein
MTMSFFGFGASSDVNTPDGINIHDTANDVPEFKRVYTIRLDNRATMKITMKTFLNRIMTSGELTQPNGRWVLFEPERVADKILDPTLVPIIERYVAEIFAIDKPYRASVSEFTDDNGTTWRKVVA